MKGGGRKSQNAKPKRKSRAKRESGLIVKGKKEKPPFLRPRKPEGKDAASER
jgi:hypothetical protein